MTQLNQRNANDAKSVLLISIVFFFLSTHNVITHPSTSRSQDTYLRRPRQHSAPPVEFDENTFSLSGRVSPSLDDAWTSGVFKETHKKRKRPSMKKLLAKGGAKRRKLQIFLRDVAANPNHCAVNTDANVRSSGPGCFHLNGEQMQTKADYN